MPTFSATAAIKKPVHFKVGPLPAGYVQDPAGAPSLHFSRPEVVPGDRGGAAPRRIWFDTLPGTKLGIDPSVPVSVVTMGKRQISVQQKTGGFGNPPAVHLSWKEGGKNFHAMFEKMSVTQALDLTAGLSVF